MHEKRTAGRALRPKGDVLYRARRLADSGAQGVFADMHPELSFADGELRGREAVR